MALEGGLRDRMVLESVLQWIKSDLTTRDWFDTGRQHLPITVIDVYPGQEGEETEVPLNTMAFSLGDSFQNLLELGSKAETHVVPVYVDFYGESDALTRHVLGDIYLRLNKDPVIPVYDYSLATPVVDFHAMVVEESVEVSYPSRATNPWQKHWGIVSCLIEDDRENA